VLSAYFFIEVILSIIKKQMEKQNKKSLMLNAFFFYYQVNRILRFPPNDTRNPKLYSFYSLKKQLIKILQQLFLFVMVKLRAIMYGISNKTP
jgi:hypothetical protein